MTLRATSCRMALTPWAYDLRGRLPCNFDSCSSQTRIRRRINIPAICCHILPVNVRREQMELRLFDLTRRLHGFVAFVCTLQESNFTANASRQGLTRSHIHCQGRAGKRAFKRVASPGPRRDIGVHRHRELWTNHALAVPRQMNFPLDPHSVCACILKCDPYDVVCRSCMGG